MCVEVKRKEAVWAGVAAAKENGFYCAKITADDFPNAERAQEYAKEIYYCKRMGGYRGHLYRWRIKVLIAGNFSCELCGETKKRRLTTHHIFPLYEKPEWALAVGNGQILCYTCHRRVHANEIRLKRGIDLLPY